MTVVEDKLSYDSSPVKSATRVEDHFRYQRPDSVPVLNASSVIRSQFYSSKDKCEHTQGEYQQDMSHMEGLNWRRLCKQENTHHDYTTPEHVDKPKEIFY